jgi:hypothetical protein
MGEGECLVVERVVRWGEEWWWWKVVVDVVVRGGKR